MDLGDKMKSMSDEKLKELDDEIKNVTGCKHFILISSNNKIDLHLIN